MTGFRVGRWTLLFYTETREDKPIDQMPAEEVTEEEIEDDGPQEQEESQVSHKHFTLSLLTPRFSANTVSCDER